MGICTDRCMHPGCTRKTNNRLQLCPEHRTVKCADRGCENRVVKSVVVKFCKACGNRERKRVKANSAVDVYFL